MALLIDGYNLLHVTALVGHGGLRSSRESLLRFLAAAIDPRERPQTTIVFDAVEAPPGLPRTMVYEEMTIHFSSDYDNADEMIEALIAGHNVPRSLLVVSSDHRLQRAARRRKAPFIDSDVWFADALRQRARNQRPIPKAAKPLENLSVDEIDYWLSQFGDVDEIETTTLLPEDMPKRGQPPATSKSSQADAAKKKPAPTKKPTAKRKRPSKKPPYEGGDSSNPFPPGYGEDLLGGDSA